jgi:16S rRNA (uracil1498-N3)-methyltransferase
MATAGGGRGPGPERAYASPLPDRGLVTLSAEESAHLVRSRRAAAGDAVVLFDGRGASRAGRVAAADPRAAVVEVLGPAPDREPGRRVTLAVSLPEAGRTDDLVSVLAELGVAVLIPLSCARTPAGRLDRLDRRRERWARLAREAAKVSGRSRLLEVADARDLASLPGPGTVLLDPDPARPSLAEALRPDAKDPVLAVGPEGGFTEAEVDALLARGGRAARLTVTALRTEVAAAAAAAVALVGFP